MFSITIIIISGYSFILRKITFPFLLVFSLFLSFIAFKMNSLNGRVELQKARFNLIQEAADLNNQEIIHMSRQLILTKISLLEQNWMKFCNEHEELCKYKEESIEVYDYVRERYIEIGQAFYIFARSQLITHLDKPETSRFSSILTDKETTNSMLPRSALPRIKLPNFAGDYKTWRSFRDLFHSMIINNSDLTHVERIHYLKTCLTGEAARLVGNLTASTENFEIACTLLSARYENKRFLITAQLDRIANLKPIKTKIANGLRTPLTTILESLGALRALDCAVQHWNPFMIQHITRLLDPKTRKDWEISLGATEEYPNMKRFQMFLGGRARALENLNTTTFVRNKENHRPFFLINPRHPIRNVAHTATSNSDSTSNKCLLCGATHLLQKCERYVALDSCKRKDFLIKKKRCFNCLGAHMASKCRSTRRCFTCGQKHHTSLHCNDAGTKLSSTIATEQTSDNVRSNK
ncbi:uncharacterized protein [Cardiocondyla obscurior]|uniref:uncharacterized protein n=1 Tax=Cardiocondyla obscurior TaxID=286306 RepID=UPI00396583EB